MAAAEAFADVNQTFVGPAGSGISDLPVHVTSKTVVSCWKLTPLEVQEVLKTGRVWVHILGHTVIPLAVSGHDPFSENLPPGHVRIED